MVKGEARQEDGALLKSVADQIPGRTICAFGEAASWPTQSFLTKFGDEFEAYPETKKTKSADAIPLV
jgi:NADH-quinone oxidoreductase subunit F